MEGCFHASHARTVSAMISGVGRLVIRLFARELTHSYPTGTRRIGGALRFAQGMRRPFRENPKQNKGISMPDSFVVTPATGPAPLNVVGEQITVLASGSRTGGYEIFRQAGPKGSGPLPHRHPWDESFYMVRGKVAFNIGGKDMIAEPGTLVHLPAGTMHWFRYGEGGGEMISMTSREEVSHFFTDRAATSTALAFDPEAIGKRRYAVAQAALRRACERLHKRKLIVRDCVGSHGLVWGLYRRAGIGLTETGVALADELIAGLHGFSKT
jgi:quercetin dioxygenase-like cupin family protein